MIRHQFDYQAPTDADAAQALLDEGARVLAGGTWVVPEMAAGRMTATRVVDLRHCGLNAIKREPGGLALGATVTYAQVLDSDLVRADAPLVRTVAAGITGGFQILYQGTLGGSACYANPASDVPALLVALDAQLRLLGAQGKRMVAARHFFRAAHETVAAPDEMLTAILLPIADGQVGYGYEKLKRGDSSWPIATAACHIEVGGDGLCRAARLVLGGVAATPLSMDFHHMLADVPLEAAAADASAELAREVLADPWSDALADQRYRREVAGVLGRRAVLRAADCLKRGESYQ